MARHNAAPTPTGFTEMIHDDSQYLNHIVRCISNVASNAIGYAKFTPVHVTRVYDAGGNVIETHEHKGDFKEW